MHEHGKHQPPSDLGKSDKIQEKHGTVESDLDVIHSLQLKI